MAAAYATVQDAQDQLDISDTSDDAYLDVCLNAASRAVDQWCNRRFYKDTSATARYYTATDPRWLDVDDFWSTTGLVVATDAGDSGSYATTWTTSDYELHPINGIAAGYEDWPYTALSATGNLWFPTPRMHRNRVSVTAKWGWANVPDEVKLATILKAVRLYRRKFSPDGAAGGFTLPVIKVTTREDPDVAMLLEPFRKRQAFVA